ncbi:G protein-coupled receptor 137Ba-like [Littorina saxatilis]|uniref:Integral membrane protein GPR137B-like n=1 Tax=Littorina saxatilis TaxID=31220 RepID=A0AAN9BFA9_9CAEN
MTMAVAGKKADTSIPTTPPVMEGIGARPSATMSVLPTWGPLPTLKPALLPSVELNVTIVYIAIYALLFLFVYVQLWMIWYYRHKRFSYQTVFLFCCLIWSGLRTTLFSFYFQDCDLANNLPIMLYWLLYCFPVCLQFTMLCLMVLFFAQVVFKARAKYEPSKYKKPLRVVIVMAVVVFVLSNLACAVAVRIHEKQYYSTPMYLLYSRVAVNDSLFVIFAIALAYCMFRMTKLSSSSLVLEAKGTSVCQAVAMSVLIVTLFTSRAVYNFITISPSIKNKLPGFGYDWVNVSDQVDAVQNLSESFAYVSFGIVLFVWEVLPISLVVVFFRVKRQSSAVALTDFSTSSHGSKVFFFDNPRRYDSDDDLSQIDARSRSPGESGSYSINRSSSQRGTPISTPRGTPISRSIRQGSYGTPRVLSYGAVFSGGPPGSRGASPMPGSLPTRALMPHTHSALMSSATADLSPSDSVMTPPPHAILNGPHDFERQRLVHTPSRESIQRSQEFYSSGGRPV